jgi:uncharacterized protein (TIGR02246 family)
MADSGRVGHDDARLIADLVHRYADAVVHQDAERWAACWGEDDVVWDLGKGRLIMGKEAIVAYWLEAIAELDTVVQTVQNGQVTVDGDEASARWYITEHVARADGGRHMLLAFYDDTYRCVDGRWLVTSRRLTQLYHGPPDLSAPFLPPPGSAAAAKRQR